MLQQCKSTYSRKLRLKVVKEWYTYDIHVKSPNCPPPPPLFHLCPKFFYLLYLGRPRSNKPPLPNYYQSIKRKHMLPGPISKSAFVFNINSLILLGFPLTSFHLAEASLSAFVWFYTRACSCPNITNCLLLIIV